MSLPYRRRANPGLALLFAACLLTAMPSLAQTTPDAAPAAAAAHKATPHKPARPLAKSKPRPPGAVVARQPVPGVPPRAALTPLAEPPGTVLPRVAIQPVIPVQSAPLPLLPSLLAGDPIPSMPPIVLPGIAPRPVGPPATATAAAPVAPPPSPVAAPSPAPSVVAAQAPPAAPPLCVEDADIATLQSALGDGRTSAAALVQAYLARIAAYDRAGPSLDAVRELNPDAAAIATRSDGAARPHTRRLPLEGIPILLKDNIGTGDAMHTTGGALALADAQSKRDATVVAKLRRAGAVLLGKTNLTELAAIVAIGMPPGYSSLGGQVRNAYVPALDGQGVPLVSPGGSSAGSAVAVAAGFAAAALGTETSGSLLLPASRNMVVTIKPTMGLISRAGVIPLALSQDVVGPIARNVHDAALLLGVLAGADPLDPATAHTAGNVDYTRFLDPNALRGKRIGVPSDPHDVANDVFYSQLSDKGRATMEAAIAVLQAQGVTIVRENMPTAGWIGGPGTGMPILVHNTHSPLNNKPTRYALVQVYEFKHDLNAYLKEWPKNTDIHSLDDIVAFNAGHPDTALRFAQDLLLAADATRGDLSEPEYAAARLSDIRSGRTLGLDAYLEENKLVAVLFPADTGADMAATAGFPSVQVPAGFTSDDAGRQYPLGATFTGRAFSEPSLIGIAYAFEQASHARRPPPDMPPLDACVAK